jgi:AcrR family transcriptional regulator
MRDVVGRRDRGVRRRQLVEAAYKVLAERGSEETRISDIAERAGVASSLVSYYFPSKDDLLLEATRFGMDRFFVQRSRVLAKIEDPLERLESAVRWAMPVGPKDPDWTVLMEFWTRALRRAPLQTVATLFQARAHSMYASIVDAIRADGRCNPVASSDTIANWIVAMLDGLAIRVIMHDPAIDAEEMERLAVDFARLAVGALAAEGTS